jgi:flagellar M-ring protein FliF
MDMIAAAPLAAEEMMDPETGIVDAELLSQQVGLAQRIVAEKPENAVVALRQMLNQPAPAAEAAQ